MPDKYYVLIVNLFLPNFTLDNGTLRHIYVCFCYFEESNDEKKLCIRRKTATIESQYNEFHHRISNETIPIVCIRG